MFSQWGIKLEIVSAALFCIFCPLMMNKESGRGFFQFIFMHTCIKTRVKSFLDQSFLFLFHKNNCYTIIMCKCHSVTKSSHFDNIDKLEGDL